MKSICFLLMFLLKFNPLFAQDFTGQWKGIFTNEKNGSKTTPSFSYVIELRQQGKNLVGVSYSYYTEKGKKFYSICSVVAKKKAGTNIIEIWETKRTKTNNSSSYSGLQNHKLVYIKNGENEILQGTWDHVYDKTSVPGAGKTKLIRNQKQQTLAQISKAFQKKNNDLAKAKSLKEKAAKNNQANIATDSNKIKTSIPITRNASYEAQKISSPTNEMSIPDKVGSYTDYRSRKKNVIRTIYTSSTSLVIDIYDNGEIDGDSITVLYNDKIVQFKQMLKAKPLSFTIELNQDNSAGYELVMYAENLGTIPPNTALMIITDAKKRYEVRVSSDLLQSGAIKFIPQKMLQ